MKVHLIAAISLSIFAWSNQNSANAQDQAVKEMPCSAPEYRELDFWLGDWELSWGLPDGKLGHGRNLIVNTEYGKCVVTENFSTPGFTGMSVSTYDPTLKKWRQTWVDDQGGYYALVGGVVEGKEHAFELVAVRESDKSAHLRMIWQDVKNNSLKWRWQKQGKDKQWRDLWVITYQRRKT